MSYKNISAEIATILSAIDDIKKVDSEAPKERIVFPAAVISAAGHQSDYSSTSSNMRVFRFNIQIFESQSTEGYEAKLMEIADTVIDTLEENTSLNSSCEFNKVEQGVWGWTETEVPERFVNLTVAAHKRKIVR